MQKVIDQITNRLVSLVTNENPIYSLKELLKAGIPLFVVEGIRPMLENKVKEEIGTINPEWFDGSKRLVQDARKDYIRSAISSSHIPRVELYTVLHTVIKDIVFVFVEPRKNMAEYIFRDDEELAFQELETRSVRLTIYKHFGIAITLYMKKRKLKTLTKDRCKQLIHKLDAKLVSHYTVEDWAQKLEQLFVLFGGKVDPLLMSTFFEDKGLHEMAEKFKKINQALTKSNFIQIISSEDFEIQTSKGIPLEEENLSTKKEEKAKNKDQPEEKSLMDNFSYRHDAEGSLQENTLAGQYSDPGLSDEEMTELLSGIELHDFEQADSLNKLFAMPNEEEKKPSVSETAEEIPAKIKEQKNDEQPDTAGAFMGDEPEEEQESIFEEPSDNENSKGQPIWAQFLGHNQMDIMMEDKQNNKRAISRGESEEKYREDSEEGVKIHNTFIEGSIIEEGARSDEPEFLHLEELLKSRKEEFIEVVFSGSKTKYNNALKKIAKFENWQETTTFIQKDIFAKNNVDMFSGATVDFTDRLHQFFNKLTN